MTDFYVAGNGGAAGSGTYRGDWAASTNFAVGDRVVCRPTYGTTAARAFIYECTADAGSSGASEPSWPTTAGNTVVDSGITWTCRACTSVSDAGVYLDYLMNKAMTAGDTCYCLNTANTTKNALADYSSAGTNNAPLKIFSVSDLSNPTTTISPGATFNTTGGNVAQFFAGFAYLYGIKIYQGNVFKLFAQVLSQGLVFESCILGLNASGASFSFGAADPDEARIQLINTDLSFSHTNQFIQMNGSYTEWRGGAMVGASVPTTLMKMSGQTIRYTSHFDVNGVDLSALTTQIIDVTDCRGPKLITVSNSKLGSGCAVTGGTWTYRDGAVVKVYNVDAGDTSYNYYFDRYTGTIEDELTLVRTGGASPDGTTGYSWKVTTKNASFVFPTETEQIAIWNETTGSAMTATMEILHDSATNLTDGDIWIEVEYLGEASTTKSTFVTDRMTYLVSTPTDQASSSETWTTTGMSNPNKQKLVSPSFTPEQKGYIKARVCIAVDDKTVYIDPVITIA